MDGPEIMTLAEFAVRMQLDWAVLYDDPTTDPFTTINPSPAAGYRLCGADTDLDEVLL